MAERQIKHRKSRSVLSVHFLILIWLSLLNLSISDTDNSLQDGHLKPGQALIIRLRVDFHCLRA